MDRVKCIIDGCEHDGKIWVNKEGPYCYTHHHENVLNIKNNNNTNQGKVIKLKPLSG